ncbi:ATP-binding protein [Burkholderia gladioli]|uniref:ATP-binding protein n=1 Tax=Burkholderia gladioli TaxID=28095 RepID=UPI0016412429|nr:ATP-binding protein [Burkholderia gladioli]
MNPRRRLGRQIVWSMGLVSVITTLIAFVGSYLIYGLLFTYLPQLQQPEDSWVPRTPDYLIFAGTLLVALVAAIVIALRLARRILAPLNSLAESARAIAAGDLAARAIPGDRTLGETAHLVDDFNSMAGKLQTMAADMAQWNAAIAHELRTPLTILQGRLQGLADGAFKPDNALIRGLLSHVEGLSRLVDDLRIVTLQDSGHFELRSASTDLGEEARRAVESIRPALEEAGFVLELRLAPAVARCDGARVRQALIALLDNARRYATPGPLRVAVARAGELVVLSVEDAGPGLAAEFAKQAFAPFTRADASRSRQLGGSGLGLSVVRAIAMAHGGWVQYRTSAQGGAVFEIELPIKGR